MDTAQDISVTSRRLVVTVRRLGRSGAELRLIATAAEFDYWRYERDRPHRRTATFRCHSPIYMIYATSILPRFDPKRRNDDEWRLAGHGLICGQTGQMCPTQAVSDHGPFVVISSVGSHPRQHGRRIGHICRAVTPKCRGPTMESILRRARADCDHRGMRLDSGGPKIENI